MKSAGKLEFLSKALFPFSMPGKIRPKCVTDFWTVVAVLFRCKSSRAQLEEHGNQHAPNSIQEKKREKAGDRKKGEEVGVICVTLLGTAEVRMCLLLRSLLFSHDQPPSKCTLIFVGLIGRHLAVVVKPATTFIKMTYPLIVGVCNSVGV